MAFGAEELRVLRRALALALHPGPAPASASPEDVQDCLRLAESVDEAAREGVRLRAFLVADLARYRAALPGTTAGFLTLLEEALGAGYRPEPDDLAALRALRGNPVAAALLDRCLRHADRDVRARLGARVAGRQSAAPTVPASRTRLLALPGGLATEEHASKPGERPAEKQPHERPAPAPRPAAPKPDRPVPTPGEVFPRRKPAPPVNPPRQLAAG